MGQLDERLQALRGERSLYEVEKATGLSRLTISRYERNENVPSAANLRILANYYGVEYSELRMLYYDDSLAHDKEERVAITKWAFLKWLEQYSSSEGDEIDEDLDALMKMIVNRYASKHL